MPILDPGDFEGFDVTRVFSSRLHSPQIAIGGRLTKFYRDFEAATFFSQNFDNFSELGRFSVANLAMTRGLMSSQLPALETLFLVAPRITLDEILDVVESVRAIAGALLQFDEALDQVATKVPVVGWVVQLGLGVYRWIDAVIDSAKAERDTTAQARAIAYDKQADEDLCRTLLQEMKRSDWTPLFLPQQRSESVCTTTLDYTSNGQRDGIAWEVCGAAQGWGLVPGLSTKFTGAVGVYQSPRRLPGSTRDAGIESIRPFGSLHPSVLQLGLMAWQMCLKNSPLAFAIDGARIASAWDDNYAQLVDWADMQADPWLRSQIYNGAQWIDPLTGASRVPDFDPDDLPSRYVQSGLYSELVWYVVAEIWSARLSGYLETLTVAYVPPDAPALLASPTLAQKHRDMRAELLRHPAIYRVEYELVPDEGYRSDVYRAQMTIPPAFTAEPPEYPRFKWLDEVPPVNPEAEPPPEPPTDPAPFVPADETPGGGGGAVLVVGMLLGLLAVAKAR